MSLSGVTVNKIMTLKQFMPRKLKQTQDDQELISERQGEKLKRKTLPG